MSDRCDMMWCDVLHITHIDGSTLPKLELLEDQKIRLTVSPQKFTRYREISFGKSLQYFQNGEKCCLGKRYDAHPSHHPLIIHYVVRTLHTIRLSHYEIEVHEDRYASQTQVSNIACQPSRRIPLPKASRTVFLPYQPPVSTSHASSSSSSSSSSKDFTLLINSMWFT